jgi:hypothetical protein
VPMARRDGHSKTQYGSRCKWGKRCRHVMAVARKQASRQAGRQGGGDRGTLGQTAPAHRTLRGARYDTAGRKEIKCLLWGGVQNRGATINVSVFRGAGG